MGYIIYFDVVYVNTRASRIPFCSFRLHGGILGTVLVCVTKGVGRVEEWVSFDSG